MRPPTIFLHIGTEKTGTSTVQVLFRRNRAKAPALGLYYPETPLLAGGSVHLGLVYYAAGAGDRLPLFHGVDPRFEAGSETFKRDFVASLADEITASGCPRVLLSCEFLSSSLRTQASVDRLIAALREITDDIRVIIYLRPQYELVVSAYQTSVKGGRATACRAPQARDPFFNYDILLNLWENSLGADRIIVRLFNRAEFKDGAFLEDFFDVLSMKFPPWAANHKVLNTRLSAEAVAFLRIVNAATLTSRDRWRAERLPHALDALALALERFPDAGGLPVAADTLCQTDEMFAESNKAVASRYFPQRTVPLFAPYKRPEGTGEPTCLTPERAVEIALYLWKTRTETLAETRAELRRLRDIVTRAAPKGPATALAKVAATETRPST
jgi:hypothetical protein